MTARNEYRAKCMETMARANHQAFDRLSKEQQRRLIKAAGKYLDALHGIAFVIPPIVTVEMDKSMRGCGADDFLAVARVGNLTNPPEKT